MDKELAKNLNSINVWISKNRDTDPNFYEIMDSMIRVGELQGDKMESFKELNYMLELRDIDHVPFLKENSSAGELFNTVRSDVVNGTYQTNSVEMGFLLRKCLSVPFYIWQTRKNGEAEYLYDNDIEYADMCIAFDSYKEKVGENGKYVSTISDLLRDITAKSIYYENNLYFK